VRKCEPTLDCGVLLQARWEGTLSGTFPSSLGGPRGFGICGWDVGFRDDLGWIANGWSILKVSGNRLLGS